MAMLTPELKAVKSKVPKTESPLVLDVAPKTPPTSDTERPRPQKTAASPAAKARVGNRAALSLRSPVALEMYDTVNGRSPRLHGEKLVKSPAKYNTTRDDAVTPPSEEKADDAIPDAILCAPYTISSKLPGNATIFKLLVCILSFWWIFRLKDAKLDCEEKA
eukprot:scaffold11325_cov56-Attheya_sp.AAC.3